MICLDSTFLIDFLRNESFAVKKVSELKDEVLVTTTINIFEVMFGLHILKGDVSKKWGSFKYLIDNLDVFNLDLESSFNASKIASDLVKEGKEINAMDCLVAGIMLMNNCNMIVTRDKEYFNRVKGIKVEHY